MTYSYVIGTALFLEEKMMKIPKTLLSFLKWCLFSIDRYLGTRYDAYRNKQI